MKVQSKKESLSKSREPTKKGTSAPTGQKLNFFQLLQTGTSFKQKAENSRFSQAAVQKVKEEPEVKRKEFGRKFQENDSEESEDETLKILNEQITQTKSRRKMSIDEIEKDWQKSQLKSQQKIQSVMKKLKIKVEGDNVPPIITNFTKMQKKYEISERLMDNMKKAGYEKPTAIQMQSMPIIMEKRSLMALAPTGSGKTAAYCLPLLTKLKQHEKNGVRALIFAPTHELGEQIHREMEFLNYGVKEGVRIKFMSNINNEINAFKRQLEHIDILICTPLKFLKMAKRSHEDFEKLEFVIFDEADRYFEFNLAKQMKKILEHFQANSSLTYLLFSATIQHPVEELVKNIIHDPIKLTVGGKNNVLASIEQSLAYCQTEYGKLVEIKNIINNGQFNPPVLIFVQSKERGDELISMIKQSCTNTPIQIEKVDSDKSKEERDEAIERFRLGKTWALVCTDLMARGIDFKGVNLVINYDFPTTIINYIHRVGRTGRAGRTGKAITFFTNEDKPLLRSLGNMLKVSGCEVPDWIFKLEKADKRTLKRMEKFPLKREAISLESSKQRQLDPEFDKQLRIADGQYYCRKRRLDQEQKRIDRQNQEEGKPTDADSGWQIA